MSSVRIEIDEALAAVAQETQLPVAAAPKETIVLEPYRAYVLNALRREREIPLRKGREVLRLLTRLFPGEGHPLADRDLLTEGRGVFIEHSPGWDRDPNGHDCRSLQGG